MSTAESSELETTISKKVQQSVRLSVWFRQEAVVTSKGYSSLQDAMEEKFYERRGAARNTGKNE